MSFKHMAAAVLAVAAIGVAAPGAQAAYWHWAGGFIVVPVPGNEGRTEAMVHAYVRGTTPVGVGLAARNVWAKGLSYVGPSTPYPRGADFRYPGATTLDKRKFWYRGVVYSILFREREPWWVQWDDPILITGNNIRILDGGPTGWHVRIRFELFTSDPADHP